jgi:HD-GYP domain-containing protein (c-di-GMP phosphodiesterase class II)
VPGQQSPGRDQVRTAEVMAALCLATDLGMGFPMEHGLQSTLLAMRLCDRMDVDDETRSQAFAICLLFYIGCTADAEIAADLFDEGALLIHFTPVTFGAPTETMTGIMRALAGSRGAVPVRAMRVARTLPRALMGHRRHIDALCEVGVMLSARLGMRPEVQRLFEFQTERWDGKAYPGRYRAEDIPIAVRIAHVARDGMLQHTIGGASHAADVVQARSGGAFDPTIASLFARHASELLDMDGIGSTWDETLAAEPRPWSMLDDDAIDAALAAMGDFADLVSPYLVGHSSGVATLATAAAQQYGFGADDVVALRRASYVHDIGRVAISAHVWQKAGPLTTDEWERVRLHAYHSERVLCRSGFLNQLTDCATCHHERADGSGYHRGATGGVLSPAARLLAAADAYHAMTEPRPHRPAMTAGQAAASLEREANEGRLDANCVSAVLTAAGHRPHRLQRPAGLTEREAQVLGLLARGLQTKQVARALGVSTKTADRHVQNVYAKIGVSTRAAAALFAMQHGLTTWGEFPMGGASSRP